MGLKVGILLLMIGQGSAKDIGIYGPIFDIKEQSLLEVIQQRVGSLQASGKFHLHQEQIQKRVEASIRRPSPVPGIKNAESYHAYLYDPAMTVSQDLKDQQGNVFAHKGQRVNPLDIQSFGKPLLFINGDVPEQVAWALKQDGKIVLVQGSPLELEQLHKVVCYFDQGGVLTEKFSINQVPARVSEQAKHLLIEMMPPYQREGE